MSSTKTILLAERSRSQSTLKAFFIGYNKNLLYPVHVFVLHCGFQNYLVRRAVACKDHAANLKVSVTIQAYGYNKTMFVSYSCPRLGKINLVFLPIWSLCCIFKITILYKSTLRW